MINSSETNIPQREHTGVYGVNISNDGSQVLLILKSRGPYKGMYDLPGGGIEKAETNELALRREYEEEIGCDILSYSFLYEDSSTFSYISQTEGKVNFRHKGFFYKVVLPNNANIKMSPDGHDSMGAIYVDISDIVNGKVMVAPMARKAILSVLQEPS
jgi:8-oxo-dGTP diphosphatase